MQLAFRELGGDGAPIVILHGLFGSSQNWVGMGRKLASEGAVYALDLRNHGDSPHAPTHTLADCVEDVLGWASSHTRGPLRIIGHSMGGLVAMGVALARPGAVAGIAALDIAPRPYPVDHERELAALSTDLGGCASRADLDSLLAPLLPDARVRQFILTNAVRGESGFRWRLNVEALRTNTVAADFARVQGRCDAQALLVASGKSGYVTEQDHALMRRYFPNARIEQIPDADHWPHVSAPAALEALLRRFLADTAGPQAPALSSGAMQ